MMHNNIKQKLFPIILIIFILFSPLYSIDAENKDICDYKSITNSFSSKNAYSYLEELTSDKFEGRQSGSKGAELAAEWIANLYESYGLIPGINNSYYQEFDIPYYEVMPPLFFSINSSKINEEFIYKKDFIVLPGSGSGSIESKVVFVGYGITSGSKGYDDYKKVDVSGKIALIMRRGPETFDLGEEALYFKTKIDNAVEHGAIGVIVSEKATEKNKMNMNTKYVSSSYGSIPVLFATCDAANKFLLEKGTSLIEVEKKIDKEKTPFSFETNCSCKMEVNVLYEVRKTSNVIGYLPAKDHKTEDSVLITAHYDHLGRDNIDGSIYRGANDNASGTSVLLEIAHSLSVNFYLSEINIVFIAFSGEEEGLCGSFFYVNNPIFPIKKIKAVLNMDMVGTGSGKLYAGTDPVIYKELSENIKVSCDCLKMNVPINKRLLSSGSDHYFFHINKVPNVFFIRDNPTGIGGYHDTLDTVDTVDPANLKETGDLVILITSIYANPFFITFDEYYWKEKVSLHERILFSGVKRGDMSLTLNEEEIPSDLDKFYKVFSLNSGDNVINIRVLIDGKLCFEKIINIKCASDENLICDFNFDLKVDLNDLIEFSRFYKDKVSNYGLNQIFDINNDSFVNEFDLSKFDSCFGYFYNN
ncbi:MAG: M28 family peptidase [Caldisericia bacterium]|nr:M28 family peptidase [Caldisericia bacterium]